MNRGWHVRPLLAALAVLLSIPPLVSAQPAHTGQDVQPIFEGWAPNADGTFTLSFGYLNRNYSEHVIVPVGADNSFGPDVPDRGQPTYFYARMHRFVFSVTVPKDFGKKEIVWTLTVHGHTNQAVGFLQPDWEIDRKTELTNSGRGTTFDDDDVIAKNQPPTLRVAPVTSVTLPQTARLVATVTDPDHLPPPDPPRQQLRATGQETPPTLQGNGDAPVNVPLGPNRPPSPPRGRLTVNWIVHRGPAGVTFEPGGWQDVKNDQAATTATFRRAGEYVLRAVASDGMYIASTDVKITVAGQR